MSDTESLARSSKQAVASSRARPGRPAAVEPDPRVLLLEVVSEILQLTGHAWLIRSAQREIARELTPETARRVLELLRNRLR